MTPEQSIHALVLKRAVEIYLACGEHIFTAPPQVLTVLQTLMQEYQQEYNDADTAIFVQYFKDLMAAAARCNAALQKLHPECTTPEERLRAFQRAAAQAPKS